MNIKVIFSCFVGVGVLNQIKSETSNFSEKECGWDVQVLGYCPGHSTLAWQCLSAVKSCPKGTTYHCARSYGHDVFVEACAEDIMCAAGTEPRIDTQGYSNGKAKVVCELCHDADRYNPYPSQSSAIFSECPKVKEECTQLNHRIQCPNNNHSALYTEDRSCRCDARRNYCPLSQDGPGPCSRDHGVRCVYEGGCRPTTDGRKQERLLDCSCAPVCQDGYRRTELSDDCIVK